MPIDPSDGEATRVPPATDGLVIGDFLIAGRRVFVRKTGNGATIDRRLVFEVATWLIYHLIVRVRGALRRRRKPGRTIWFTPDRPHPRYMVRSAAIWAGIGLARREDEADAAFFFEDATTSPAPASSCRRRINFGCTDISKSHVAAVFERAFGYPLSIDPEKWRGVAVEKSEANGTHDGRIISCPRPRRPGKAYQRLIDTIAADGYARDLRTHCVGGVPIIVWVKSRDPARRFLPPNRSATMHAPAAIFGADELRSIARFAEAMGADWCGLDILRDRDGRIYIVDVNKTDAGPIVALPLRRKLASIALLAASLERLL